MHKTHTPKLKAQVALEAIREHKTINQIASEFGVHNARVYEWKKHVVEGLPELFSTKKDQEKKSQEAFIAALYQQIGQLQVELDWLKKKTFIK